ncbi:MAG: ATP-binding protein [Hyphomicrobiaceae bacterium]
MWSIRRALIVGFLLAAALPLLLICAWPYVRPIAGAGSDADDKYLLLARNTAAALNRYAADIDATFDFLAESLLANESVGQPEALLRRLRIHSVSLVDIRDGHVLARFGEPLPGDNRMLAPEELSRLLRVAKSSRDRPTRAMLAADGSRALFLVRTKGDRAVVARIGTSYFHELAGSISFGSTGHAVIVDQTGRVLAHPDAAWEQEAKDLSSLAVVARAIRGETGTGTYLSGPDGIEMFAGFAPAGKTGWGVLVTQPVSELKAEMARGQRPPLLFLMLALLAAGLCAHRFSMLIVGPLKSIKAAANRSSDGEPGARAAIPGRLVPGELQSVAATFNMMVDKVTEARARETEARRRAEADCNQKSKFVRYVTHELRSPVNAILGFVKLESMRVPRDDGSRGRSLQMENLRHIEEAATHLLSLINDLLDLGKIEAGHHVLNDELVGLDEIVNRCIRMLGHAAAERNVKLIATYEREAPTVLVDERAMYQIILNLMTNAVRYGRRNGVVEMRSYAVAGGGLEICICDDGPGIAHGDLERVMLPFERIERAGHEAQHGTGLGLPIVKKLVELHGGTFRLESEVGIGTVAYILLPARRCPPSLSDSSHSRAA